MRASILGMHGGLTCATGGSTGMLEREDGVVRTPAGGRTRLSGKATLPGPSQVIWPLLFLFGTRAA